MLEKKECIDCGKKEWRLWRGRCFECKRAHERKKARANEKANKMKKRLIAQNGNFCQTCWQVKPLIAHHVMPLAIGGSDDEENIILVCRECHMEIHKEIGMKGERYFECMRRMYPEGKYQL